MATNYPTSKDVLTNPTATDKVSVVNHADQHANANDAIEALETKVGIDGSAVTTTHDYKLSSVIDGEKSVSTSGNQTIAGDKTFSGTTVMAGLTSEGLNAGDGDINTTGDVNGANIALNTAKISANGSIATHSDVSLAGIVTNDLLEWDGSGFVPKTPTATTAIEAAVFQDEKPSGTAAQTVTATYTARDLNTTIGNTSIDTNISLSSNQITLKAGSYLIEGQAPIQNRTSKPRIYNITDSTVEFLGSSQDDSGSGDVQRSMVKGIITTASTKVYEFQQRVNVSTAVGGRACGFGDNEVYTQISITKIG